MKRSNRLVLLVGVFLAVIAFVGIAFLLNGNGTGPNNGQVAPPTELPTVIAAKDIPLGAVVTEDMLATQLLKIDTERKATAFTSTKLVVGNIARRSIVTGTGPNNGQVAPPTELPTVLAAKDIPLGAVVTEDMLSTVPLKIDTERKATAFTSTKLVVGNIARRSIVTGTQLESAYFDTSTTGCGVIDVPLGLRAIAVQVDQVSGVGTVINTGDYVDAVVGFTGDKFPVVTLNPDDDSITVVAGLNGTSVKLLVEGMQVLCRQLPPVAAPAQGAAPAPSDGGPTVSLNGQQEIVMLGVTASQAEVIKFSQLDGSISLVLRSRKDFLDEAGNPIPALPSATEGVTLAKLTKDFAVPIPELVEAILPAQAKP